jgi:hypothetical protein
MRRHAEDLIVLSGSKPARGWRRPVPIKDVIRGAVAEVEDYTRVKVLPVAGGAISGHAVGDVIHMLAELIENATSFSPPHTPVHVSGHEVSNGCAIEVEDRGLGMTDEEFAAVNARLADPPPFDLTTSERLGLFVVGRLADRHGIRVRLRSSPYGGTMAIVLVPVSLMRPESDAPVPAEVVTDTLDASPDTVSGGTDGERELVSVGAPAGPSLPTPRESAVDGIVREPGAHEAGYASPYSPPTEPEPEPAGSNTGDRPLMDDLPVFATVRSSWFISDRDRSSAQRRWVGDPASTGELAVQRQSDYGVPGPGVPVGSAERIGEVRTAEVPGIPAESMAAPTGPTGLPDSSGFAPQPPYAQPVDHRMAQAPETTEVGLPKRTRRANLAPQLRRDGASDDSPPAVLAGPRSPEEVRSMMSSFQANFGRGLADGQISEGDEDDDATRGR